MIYEYDKCVSKLSYDLKAIGNLVALKLTIGAIVRNSIRGFIRLQKSTRIQSTLQLNLKLGNLSDTFFLLNYVFYFLDYL